MTVSIGLGSEGRSSHIHSRVYGFELLLDLQGCDSELFNRPYIDQYFTDLCKLIDMEKCDVHFWDDVGVPVDERQTLPHAKGTSAVCFILTSSIVIHTLDLLEAVFVNIFSCKSFDPKVAEKFTRERFAADFSSMRFVERRLLSQHSRDTS
ncbi:MAG: S-adenosylmethionine decarboxylase [Gammaproteobacteria bacterium]|nr:S-adenosylmethionine decarboxylase [Gammaproteobacteria bacterium]